MPARPQAITVGDFNRDGKTDLAVAAGSVVLLLGKGDGTFTPSTVNLENPSAVGIAAADFDRDGFLDLAVVGDRKLTVLLGRGDGTFRAPAVYTNAQSITSALGLI